VPHPSREKEAQFIRKLRWADFTKVSKSRDGVHDAQTRADIRYTYKVSEKSDGSWEVSKVHVHLSLNHRETWVVRGKERAELLSHEQQHYDISAIAARTVRAKLRGLKGNGSQEPGMVIGEIVTNAVGTQAQEVQDKYDEDAECGSDHGRKPKEQKLWNVRIHEALFDSSATLESLESCPRSRQNTETGE
jgi:hypothetical protein